MDSPGSGREACRRTRACYTITDYDVKAILHTDNTIDVTERIGVYFTEERHGIYRNIPMEMTVVRDFQKQDKSEEKIFRYGSQDPKHSGQRR